jgi:hypothetical protein
MTDPHPHAEAAYRLLPLNDGKFAVEVAIPGSHPTKVTGLDSQALAEAWIERHKQQVATGTIKKPSWGRRFQRSQVTRAPAQPVDGLPVKTAN